MAQRTPSPVERRRSDGIPKVTEQPKNPVLLVHGGAWAIPDDVVEDHLRGVREAQAVGWKILEKGGSALDAVEETVASMEEDEVFDAGRGSFLTSDGTVRLDALLMDGATLRAGGVGCVEHIRNPIRAARKVLSESPHVYFVGEGAERFAAEHGIELIANKDWSCHVNSSDSRKRGQSKR